MFLYILHHWTAWSCFLSTVSSQTNTPTVCTLLWHKSGEGGAFARIFNSCCAYAPPSISSILNMYKVDNHDDCCGCILWEISSSCVDTKPRNIKASYIISDDGRLRVSASNSNISGGQWACTCFWTQSTMELSKKLTKSMHRRFSIRGHLHEGKVPM